MGAQRQQTDRDGDYYSKDQPTKQGSPSRRTSAQGLRAKVARPRTAANRASGGSQCSSQMAVDPHYLMEEPIQNFSNKRQSEVMEPQLVRDRRFPLA